MDPLTQICSEMRIRKADFTRLVASAPWGLTSEGDPVVKFVLVLSGAAVLTTESHDEPIPLSCGDVFIMLDDEPYSLFDHPASNMLACMDVRQLRTGDSIRIGGKGAVSTFVCGSFEMDLLDVQPLMTGLPKLIHLKQRYERSLAFQSILELLSSETAEPGLGSEAVVSRLFELLLVQTIRGFANQSDGQTRGWLAGLGDRHLAQAIVALHAEPAKSWTVESLARTAGMSRSAFASRFKAVVGRTPLDYLTQWRIYRATRMMRTRKLSMIEICQQVGYVSPTAFNRAFKKELGVTPGTFRKEMANGA